MELHDLKARQDDFSTADFGTKLRTNLEISDKFDRNLERMIEEYEAAKGDGVDIPEEKRTVRVLVRTTPSTGEELNEIEGISNVTEVSDKIFVLDIDIDKHREITRHSRIKQITK